MKKRLFAFTLAVVLTFMSLASVIPVFAEEDFADDSLLTSGESVKYRLIDDGALLTDLEESQLSDKLNEISERQTCDILIVTVYDLGGYTADSYVEDYYTTYEYGMGADKSGIILLVSMEDRDWAIHKHGSAKEAFTNAGQEYMIEQFKPALSDGEYYEAFNKFASLCDDFLTQAKTGSPYDNDNLPKSFPFIPLLIAVAVGIVIALLIMLILKGQLRSVAFKQGAADYVRPGSMNITSRSDLYLYRTVTKTPIPKDKSGGSSGTSPSTVSGKF